MQDPKETRRWLLGLGIVGTPLGYYLAVVIGGTLTFDGGAKYPEAQIIGLAIAGICGAMLLIGAVSTGIVMAQREAQYVPERG